MDVIAERPANLDLQDMDEDRRPGSPPPRGRSYSRSLHHPCPGRRDRTPTRATSRSRSRSRSPPPRRRGDRSRSPAGRRYDRDDDVTAPAPAPLSPSSSFRPTPHASTQASRAPTDVEPTTVLGCFGLSIRTTEKDLQYEFDAIAPVEKVVVVYDARSADRAVSASSRCATSKAPRAAIEGSQRQRPARPTNSVSTSHHAPPARPHARYLQGRGASGRSLPCASQPWSSRRRRRWWTR